MPRTWDSIGRDDTLGKSCRDGDGVVTCGEELVCRTGQCRHCENDAECVSGRVCMKPLQGLSRCLPPRRMAWHRAFTDTGEFFCTVLIFLSSALAAASGTGGGGMFVPLFLLLSAMKTPTLAVPLSQCMIVCSAVVNLSTFVFQRHPEFQTQAKIDYNGAVLLEPMLMYGVTLGVVLNQMSPRWLLLVLLCATLILAFWRTFKKGMKQWAEESKMLAATPSTMRDSANLSEFVDLTNRNTPQVIGIILLWMFMLTVSLHGLRQCSWEFFGLLLGLGMVLAGGTVLVGNWIAREAEVEAAPRPLKWITKGKSTLERFKYPFVAFGAGFLGGLLGLGGGIVMSPVLLELGMHSEAVQATTAMFVFVSSSLATLQYYLLDMYVWDFALWYSAVGVFATMLGQWLCSTYVRKNKRYSAITLSIAAVVLLSLVALVIIGIWQVYDDIRTGAPMGFSFARLCRGTGATIITAGVQHEHPFL